MWNSQHVRSGAVGWALGWVIVLSSTDAAAQVPHERRFVFSGNAGLQTTVNTRTDRVDFELYEEMRGFAVTQEIPRTAVYDIGLESRMWKGLGLGANVSYTNIVTTATIDAQVPHPFFFDFPRSATGESGGLLHREWALHLKLQYWIPLGERWRLTIFGGPSLYDAQQDLVAEISVTEIGFPFDAVDIDVAREASVKITAVGFNAGFDLAYYGLRPFRIFGSSELLDRIGLAVMLRYNRAAPAIGFQGQFQPALELGGTHVAGGIRVPF